MTVVMWLRAGRLFEVVVLVLGLGAGLTMVWASLQFGGRAEVTGRLALDQAEVELGALVRREWDEFVSGPAVWESAGEARVFGLDEVRRVLGAGQPPASVEFRDRDLFEAFLSEARRLESGGARVAEIRETLDAAAGLGPGPGGRAVVALRRLQLALGEGDRAAALGLWQGMLREARGEPRVLGIEAGTPAMWLAALAVAPQLAAQERRALGVELVGWIESGKLVLSSEVGASEAELPLETEVRLGSLAAALGFDAAPLRAALLRARALRRLTELVGPGAFARAAGLASLDAGSQPAPAADPLLARAATLLPVSEPPARLILVGRRGATLATLLASRAALLDAFTARLARTPAFGGGFFTLPADADFEPGEPDEPHAARLGEPLELGPGGLSLTLAHHDPAAFIRSEGRRTDTLRLALLTAGFVTLLASALAFGALSRQRRLGILKTEFIAKVSHELRTPITGILLASEGLEEERRPSPERRERYLGLIRREAKRLERLVANVLDFSRLDRGPERWLVLEEVDLADLVASLARAAAERLEPEGVELQLDIASELVGRAAFDAEALRRATSNLIENALLHGKARRVVFGARANGSLVIAVEDDGPGVAGADSESIFAAFAQAKAPRKGRDLEPHTGAGLGLAIVREIARGHGGEIALVRAASGRLARFEMHLPLTRQAPDEEA